MGCRCHHRISCPFWEFGDLQPSALPQAVEARSFKRPTGDALPIPARAWQTEPVARRPSAQSGHCSHVFVTAQPVQQYCRPIGADRPHRSNDRRLSPAHATLGLP
jgi:hypothetical protein